MSLLSWLCYMRFICTKNVSKIVQWHHTTSAVSADVPHKILQQLTTGTKTLETLSKCWSPQVKKITVFLPMRSFSDQELVFVGLVCDSSFVCICWSASQNPSHGSHSRIACICSGWEWLGCENLIGGVFSMWKS